MTPTLLLLAGPNGSGKSTLASTNAFRAMLARIGAEFHNPDDIARGAPDGVNALMWAGRELHIRIAAAVASGTSLAIETTLSGSNHFRTADLCKSAGYRLALHFVFVSDLAIANARVRLRVKRGGHDVPLEDQYRRYARSFKNAERMISRCDEAYVYNNDLVEPLALIAEYRRGKLIFRDDETIHRRMQSLPAWLPW